MDIVLVRIGVLDDRVRAAATQLRTEPLVCTTGRDELDQVLSGLSARRLVLSCDVPGLNAVLLRLVRRAEIADVPVGWIADRDRASRDLNHRLGLPDRRTPAAAAAVAGTPVPIPLVRDDHGGLLVHRGRLGPAAGAGRFGAQSYHDDALVADGPVRGIDVTPTHCQPPAVVAMVRTARWGSASRSLGRSIQTACDDARPVVDGVAYPRSVTRWTWYADPRQHWLLAGAHCAAQPGDPGRPAPPR